MTLELCKQIQTDLLDYDICNIDGTMANETNDTVERVVTLPVYSRHIINTKFKVTHVVILKQCLESYFS